MRDCRTAPYSYTIDVGRAYDVTTRSARMIDQLEAVMVKLPQVECPVVHRFTPGLYSRECFTAGPSDQYPGGLIFTSRIHLQDHQFIISMGKVEIFCEGRGWVPFMSPYHGITPAGTRRVVRTLEDTICTTFHPTHETDLGKLEALLYLNHNGPEMAKTLHP